MDLELRPFQSAAARSVALAAQMGDSVCGFGRAVVGVNGLLATFPHRPGADCLRPRIRRCGLSKVFRRPVVMLVQGVPSPRDGTNGWGAAGN